MTLTIDRKILVLVSAGLILFIVSGALVGRVVAVEGTYSYLKLFNEALYLIVNNYVEPVQIEDLMRGAYRGMLESLDPENEYLTPRDYQRASRGETGGPAEVGMVLSKRRGYIAALSVRAGSPAAEAGLETGNLLITIDGRSTREMGVWEATQALRGRPGTTTVVTLNAMEAGNRKSVTLTRRILPAAPPVVSVEFQDVAVARVVALSEGDARRLDQGIAAAARRGATRLLIDLRGCASGNLAEAIGAASLFIKDGTVVTVNDRQEGDRAYRTDGRKIAWDRPVVVLVDESTAGVCEVLAAALRDDREAPVIGQRTWGNGSLHQLIPLQQGDGVFLAVARYLSPSGRDWHGQGLSPDLQADGNPSEPGDPQRHKAVDYLKGIALQAARPAA
jgi:carboxyl-terminal processing protease